MQAWPLDIFGSVAISLHRQFSPFRKSCRPDVTKRLTVHYNYSTPKFDHVSPVLHTLHWLPVEQRIEYNLLLLAFKSVNNDGPSYLSDLLNSTFLLDSFALPLTPVSFAFLHSV